MPLVPTPSFKQREKFARIDDLTFIIDGKRCTIRPEHPIYFNRIKQEDSRQTAVKRRKCRVDRSTGHLPQIVRPFKDPPQCLFPPPLNSESTKWEDLFLGLPFNVRWMTYRHLSIVGKTPILIRSPLSSAYKKRHKPSNNSHAILRVSKAIRHDAAEYFYTNTNFAIGSPRWDQKPELEPSPDGIQNFLSWTPRHYVNCITKLTILARLVVYFRKTEFTHADLTYFEAMMIATKESFVNLQVLSVMFTEFDGVCVPDSPLDVGIKTDGWLKTIYNSFKTVLQHQNLEEIYLGVDLIGKPARYKGIPAWDQLPDRDALIFIKDVVKTAAMKHGSWVFHWEERWDSLFSQEEENEEEHWEMELCSISRRV
ncbi:hypothetical protein ACHAO8_002648 [Botrytis cinerea]